MSRDAVGTTKRRNFGIARPPGSNALRELRDRFLADPERTDLSDLRPVIARSWLRSRACGVDPELPAIRERRDPQLDPSVIETAETVMQKLLLATPDDRFCVGLADPQGTVAALRGRPKALRWAEPRFGIGASMSEDIIGTNCVGTAIEEGRPVPVWGEEHFATSLQDSVCVSSPIRDPLRGSVRGVLSIALPASARRDALRRVTGLVDEAASELAGALAARAAPREQALLMAYLRKLRTRGAGAVMAIDGRTTIASQDALELLSDEDYPVLCGYAQESLRSRHPMKRDVVLAGEWSATVCFEPVFAGRERVGSVLQVRTSEPRLAPVSPTRHTHRHAFSAFVGESRALRRALELADSASTRRLPAHVVGEAGTGKRMLATAIAGTRTQETIGVDFEGTSEPCQEDLGRIAEALDRGGAVVLAHVDCMQPLGWRALAAVLETRASERVFMTARTLSEPAMEYLATIGSLEIVMPRLDARREDIPCLVAKWLAADDGPRRVSPRLMRLFTEATLGRNVAELYEIVTRAAVRCAGRELTTDDLAEQDRRSLTRIALSPLQTAEAEQIREALRRADGNRVRAAAILKIGRSTLYRRLDTYARLGFDLEAETPRSQHRGGPRHAPIGDLTAAAA